MTTTTTTAITSVHGDIPAELTFFTENPEDTRLPFIRLEPNAADIVDNLVEDKQTVTIHDLRGKESTFNLDTQSFLAVSNVPSVETEFADDDHIKSVYYPEIEGLVREHLSGVEQVVIFDHTIRRPGSNRTAVIRAHIDQTPEASFNRVRAHLPAERAEEVISKGLRVRIVNVWRPINGQVVDHPLAFADSTTVEESDLVPVRLIYPDREGGTLGVRHNPAHKWWYWSGQKQDEVVFLKCFDSDMEVGGGAPGRRGRVPHTAFVHPKTPEGTPGRESIEVRCLVIG